MHDNTTTTTTMPPPNSNTVSSTQSASATASAASAAPDRHMNDSTMPPPKRTNLASSTSTTTSTTTTNPRRKVPAVNPRGKFGLHDWKQLLSVSKDLAQRKGQPIRRDISPAEVKLHNQLHDGWIILRGRVYNIGPYLAYHPGGVAIMKNVLGKDASTLFDKYHRWVNIDGLIGPLLLGFVSVSPTAGTINPFSVVPPKEAHLTNAPRLSTQAASGSSLLTTLANQEDDQDEEDMLDSILPPSS